MFLTTYYHHTSIVTLSVRWCMWKVREGCLTQDIKMGSCVFKSDVPHQWLALCLYAETGWHGVACPVSAAWHSCVAALNWSNYHFCKQAPLRYDLRSLKATFNSNKKLTNKTLFQVVMQCVVKFATTPI